MAGRHDHRNRALYDAMPDSQKATADAVFGRRVRGHAAAAKPGKG
jgi:hypothetical protein